MSSLQPLDVSGNRSVKNALRQEFIEWCGEQVTKNRDGPNPTVDFSLTRVKELHVYWVVNVVTAAAHAKELVKGWVSILQTEEDPLQNNFWIQRDLGSPEGAPLTLGHVESPPSLPPSEAENDCVSL